MWVASGMEQGEKLYDRVFDYASRQLIEAGFASRVGDRLLTPALKVIAAELRESAENLMDAIAFYHDKNPGAVPL